MKIEKETIVNEDGTNMITETVENTPEDGFVKQVDADNNRSIIYHKGYQKKITQTTDDPRIIKRFLYFFCTFILGIGIFLILIKLYILGLLFISITIYTFIEMIKDLKAKEKELLKNPNYNPKDKTVVERFKSEVKKNVKDVISSTFTKKH